MAAKKVKKEEVKVRGRKSRLSGEKVTAEQGRRIRRALRAAGVNLKDFDEGETATVTRKGDMLSIKAGKVVVEVGVVPAPRGEGLKKAAAAKGKKGKAKKPAKDEDESSDDDDDDEDSDE